MKLVRSGRDNHGQARQAGAYAGVVEGWRVFFWGPRPCSRGKLITVLFDLGMSGAFIARNGHYGTVRRLRPNTRFSDRERRADTLEGYRGVFLS
jgi:hypothetical protein